MKFGNGLSTINAQVCSMREKGNDELSALMDGEATELEMHRVLRTVEDDPEQAAKWQRYHLVSAVLKKEVRSGTALSLAKFDLASRVSAALAEEPAMQKAESVVAAQSSLASPATPSVRGWWRPLANVAIAASVATVVVIGWQQSQTSVASSAPAVAHAQPSSLQPGAMAGAMPVAANPAATSYASQPASYGSVQSVVQSYGVMPRSVSVPVEYVRTQKLDEQRFNRYLISHSGNAAFATQGGQLPYVRVVTLKPAESTQR